MTTYTLLVNTSNNWSYANFIAMLLSQRMVMTYNDDNYDTDINIRRNDATNIYVFISDVEQAGQLITVCNKTQGLAQTMTLDECFDHINELFT
jgi:hypothetical protein